MRRALGVMLLCFGVAHADPTPTPAPTQLKPTTYPLATLERTVC